MLGGLVKILFVFIACFFEVLIVFCALTNKYCSPYTLDVYFGKKGCGKSTTLQKLAYKYYKKGWNCFCDRNAKAFWRKYKKGDKIARYLILKDYFYSKKAQICRIN